MPNNNINTTPIVSFKQYDLTSPKCKRIINGIKTESYVEHCKRQKQTSISSSTLNLTTPALPECKSTLIPTHSSIDTLTSLPTSIITFPSTIQKQPSIKSFLSTKVNSNNKPAKLPVETYLVTCCIINCTTLLLILNGILNKTIR